MGHSCPRIFALATPSVWKTLLQIPKCLAPSFQSILKGQLLPRGRGSSLTILNKTTTPSNPLSKLCFLTGYLAMWWLYCLPHWNVSHCPLLYSVVKVLLSHVQPFGTPWMVARQAPLSMGFSRQEYWSGLPFLSPGDLPDLGIEPRSLALQADSLPSAPR